MSEPLLVSFHFFTHLVHVFVLYYAATGVNCALDAYRAALYRGELGKFRFLDFVMFSTKNARGRCCVNRGKKLNQAGDFLFNLKESLRIKIERFIKFLSIYF